MCFFCSTPVLHRGDFIRTSICDKYSGSTKVSTRLRHVSHCETTAGTNWSNKWTHKYLPQILAAIKFRATSLRNVNASPFLPRLITCILGDIPAKELLGVMHLMAKHMVKNFLGENTCHADPCFHQAADTGVPHLQETPLS